MTHEKPGLIFLDIETTGLSLDDDIWEIAAIRTTADPEEEEFLHYFVEHDRHKCKRLPEQFRHDHYNRYRDHVAVSRNQAACYLANLVRKGDHVVGAVPNFDTERIALLLAEIHEKPRWHYHLIDVETLAVGYLAARGERLLLPWDSNELSKAVGVIPDQFERHTAIGDVLWAKAIYEAVTA